MGLQCHGGYLWDSTTYDGTAQRRAPIYGTLERGIMMTLTIITVIMVALDGAIGIREACNGGSREAG